jgi:hypothetical protein
MSRGIFLLSSILSILIFSHQKAIAQAIDFGKEIPLVKLIEVESTKTISGFLHSRPQQNFPVFMYRSHSLQKATFLSPRAIVINYDDLDSSDTTYFTFNGDPNLRGFNTIEMIRFVPEKKDFVLKEVVFKKDGPPTSEQLEDVDYETADLIVSKNNPTRCLNCHGYIYPHPLFESYLLWPGSYFSYEESNESNFGLRAPITEAAIKSFFPYIEKSREFNFWRNTERENWALFRKQKLASDPRYSAFNRPPPKPDELIEENTGINLLTTFQNAIRISHILTQHPKLDQIIQPIVMALHCEDDSLLKAILNHPALKERFRTLFKKYYKAELDAVAEELENLGSKNVDFVNLRLKQKEVSQYDPELIVRKMTGAQQLAFMRAATEGPTRMSIFTLLEDRYNDLYTDDWSMSFFGGGPFLDGNNDAFRGEILGQLKKELGDRYQALHVDESCKNLSSRLSKIFE